MVTDLSSPDGGGGTKGRPSPPLRYGDKFEELCGYYMSLGMSYYDYWDGDAAMTLYYRRMDEYHRERRNYELWLQGAYIYEALLDASPVYNALSKQKKPFPYRAAPIPITTNESKAAKERDKQERLKKGKEAMRAMVASINKRFRDNQRKREKGGEVNDGD